MVILQFFNSVGKNVYFVYLGYWKECRLYDGGGVVEPAGHDLPRPTEEPSYTWTLCPTRV